MEWVLFENYLVIINCASVFLECVPTICDLLGDFVWCVELIGEDPCVVLSGAAVSPGRCCSLCTALQLHSLQ